MAFKQVIEVPFGYTTVRCTIEIEDDIFGMSDANKHLVATLTSNINEAILKSDPVVKDPDGWAEVSKKRKREEDAVINLDSDDDGEAGRRARVKVEQNQAIGVENEHDEGREMMKKKGDHRPVGDVQVGYGGDGRGRQYEPARPLLANAAPQAPTRTGPTIANRHKMVNIKVEEVSGPSWNFQMKRATGFVKLMEDIGEKLASCQKNYKMQISWNGQRLSPHRTPEQMGMPDSVVIGVGPA